MNRYLALSSGILLSLNQFCILFSIHFIVINNSWVVFDFFFAIIMILAGWVNKENFYLISLPFCIFFLLLCLVRFCYIYIMQGYSLGVFSFTRPIILGFALYAITKKLMEYKRNRIVSYNKSRLFK